MKKTFLPALALLLAVIMAAFAFGGCKLTDEPDDPADETAAPNDPAPSGELDGTQVVMRSGDVEITLYDFGQAFYNSQYMQYYMYGMITADQLCDYTVEDLSHLIYLQRAAKDAGIELDESEVSEAEKLIEDQLEQLLTQYESSVEEDVEDKRAEARKKLEKDLAEDGIDYDNFLVLAKRNILMYKLADKYYKSVQDSLEISDEDITAYVKAHLNEDRTASVSDLVHKLSAFNEGNGPFPVYFSNDIFTVNHIYMGFETNTDDEGNAVTDFDSRKDDEAALEAKLPEAENFDGFMALEEEFGEDGGMDVEGYRKNGYAIHPDVAGEYFDGFVYAAMNLHEGSWKPVFDKETGEYIGGGERELTYFTLKDGTKVVKVYTDSGVHYIIVNKEYAKGATPVEKDGAAWESWRSTLAAERLESKLNELSAEWVEKYEIQTETDMIKAKFVPAEQAQPTDGAEPGEPTEEGAAEPTEEGAAEPTEEGVAEPTEEGAAETDSGEKP